MPRPLSWVVVAVVVAVSTVACSDDGGGDPSAFCDEVNRRADVVDTSGDVSGAVEDLRALGRLAPDEIDDVVDRTRLLFEEVRDAPDGAAAREILSTRGPEITELAGRLNDYAATQCGLDLRRPTTTPTPTREPVQPLEPA